MTDEQKSEVGEFSKALQALQDAFKKLEDDRIDALNSLRDIEILSHAMLKREAKRLSRKLGPDHPRVRHLETRLKDKRELIKALEVELELAKIQVPEVEEGGALVHGRVVDEHQRGLAGLRVHLENEDEEKLRLVDQAETNTSGYYAFPLEAKTLAKLSEAAPEGVLLVVSTRADRVIHREFEPLELGAGARTFKEIVLKRADLTPVRKEKKPVAKKEKAKEAPVPDLGVWVARGKVVDKENGQGIGGVTVSLYDKDLLFDDVLGTTLTDEEGSFEVTYQTEAFRDLFEAKPDLYVKVLDAKGRTLYFSRKAVRYEAGHIETFNITISRRVNDGDAGE